MFSIEAFKKKYAVKETAFSIAGNSFNFFVPSTLEPFIDPEDLMNQFPLWAKIWEATAVLAYRISTLEPDPGKRFLEIGAGLGVAGICAARMGHQITITEYNANALDFARANAAVNGLPSLDIRALDWYSPDIDGKFDYIIASEVIFKEEDIMSLMLLFKRYLKPGGTIILAEGMRKTSLKFLKEMEQHYTIQMKKHSIKSDGKVIPIFLFEMKEKP